MSSVVSTVDRIDWNSITSLPDKPLYLAPLECVVKPMAHELPDNYEEIRIHDRLLAERVHQTKLNDPLERGYVEEKQRQLHDRVQLATDAQVAVDAAVAAAAVNGFR